jgi:RNA polymerase sigma factor (sigma-70 family)
MDIKFVHQPIEPQAISLRPVRTDPGTNGLTTARNVGAIAPMDHKGRLLWFAREVLPHEADVRKWLSVRVRGLTGCDVDEVVQEAYARLWTADADQIINARAYLFVTARHIVSEQVRRSRIVSIELMADLETLNIVDNEVNAHRRLSGQQELARLRQILSKLPPKCRLAFQLKKFDGLSQREIAGQMNIAESTVEKHLAKALRFISREMKGDMENSEREEEPVERRFWRKG